MNEQMDTILQRLQTCARQILAASDGKYVGKAQVEFKAHPGGVETVQWTAWFGDSCSGPHGLEFGDSIEAATEALLPTLENRVNLNKQKLEALKKEAAYLGVSIVEKP